jgi:hypothetical protein
LNDWNQKEISSNAASDDEELLAKEDIIMLMQGKNAFGERIYCYLRLSINNLRRMKNAIINKEQFLPSDYGEVLAAGNGYPTPELRAEMAVKYGMMQAPKLEPKKPAFLNKPVWGEE